MQKMRAVEKERKGAEKDKERETGRQRCKERKRETMNKRSCIALFKTLVRAGTVMQCNVIERVTYMFKHLLSQCLQTITSRTWRNKETQYGKASKNVNVTLEHFRKIF